MEKRCLKCGAALQEGENFCMVCGYPAGDIPQSQLPQPEYRPLQPVPQTIDPQNAYQQTAQSEFIPESQQPRQGHYGQPANSQNPPAEDSAVPVKKKGKGWLIAAIAAFLAAAIGAVCFFGFREGGFFRGADGGQAQSDADGGQAQSGADGGQAQSGDGEENEIYDRTVLTVGDHKVTVREFNYFYISTANTLSSYGSYLGIESGTPLDQQYVSANGAMYLGLFGISTDYLADKEPVDGIYDVTWAQLIAATAKDNAVSAYAVYNEAMKAGYEIDDQLQSEIDEQMEVMQGYADANGESLNRLISRVFGSGCTADGYRDYLTVMYVASHYPSSIRYSDAEITARFNQSPEDFTVAAFYLYSVSAADFAELTDEDKDAVQKAMEAATAMEADFNDEADKVTVKVDYTRESVKNLVSEEAAAWVFDTANAGDVKTFENNGTYFVVKLIDKSDYLTMNGLELVISADSGERAEGEKSAADKVAAIKASLAADPSEANFRSLIEAYGGEPEDLEGLTRSTLGSVSNDVLKWYLDGIKAGDWIAAEVNGSTIFLYCTGLGDTYSSVAVTNILTSEWYTNVVAAAQASAVYDEDAAMTANVGLTLNG